MPGSADTNSPTPPPWNEADSFRETTLQYIDDPSDREALRHAGRVIYDLAVEASHELGGDRSVTRAEVRAALADLRYLEGYLALIGRSAEECSLDESDDALARFAGRLVGQVGAIVQAIEGRLG
jgi:hypothetical protein